MEEKKTKTAQTNQSTDKRKATYEELNNYCIQLMNQNKALTEELKKRDMVTLFKRLDYLFMVVSNRDAFPKGFVDQCVEEIQGQITIPETAEDTKEDK